MGCDRGEDIFYIDVLPFERHISIVTPLNDENKRRRSDPKTIPESRRALYHTGFYISTVALRQCLVRAARRRGKAGSKRPTPTPNVLFFFLHRPIRTLCHLSCVPKKGDPKKGTRRKFFTPCSVVLGTFRKLALRAQTVRNASPSDSVAWLNFRMGIPCKNLRFKSLPQPRTSPERPYDIFGHPSWPKEASHRANALHCLHPAFTSGTASAGRLRPKAEFARASGRGLRRVKNIACTRVFARARCSGHEGDVQKKMPSS